MPPKKATADSAANGENNGDGAFRWTAENERKLLMLTMGRTLSADDYEKILEQFPGTNLNGIKIRTSRLRCERVNIFAELGWDLPEGGKAVKRSTGVKGDTKITPKKKRAAKDEDETPTKPRVTKKAKVKTETQVARDDDLDEGGKEEAVKEEAVDEVV
ncbi:hypothetical protein B0J11DRAFT_569329 [Dendryphion nanum]|uniref:Uncharacterized protein n=1 Tax=Dendryphion nanum TaxID=256645 RepID=A0A9P9DP71_9PLEO|nr:hypothetical protein B0J11DRAFT_569329 [Dendryphion nanum]